VTFTHDNNVEYSLPGATLMARIEADVRSGDARETADAGLRTAGIRVSGVFGKRELNKKSRGGSVPVPESSSDSEFILALGCQAALRDQLDEGEWPFYVLFLEVDPTQFDVNVHPSKLEVRFADERLVHAVLFRTIARPCRNKSPGLAGFDRGAESESSRTMSEAEQFVRQN